MNSLIRHCAAVLLAAWALGLASPQLARAQSLPDLTVEEITRDEYYNYYYFTFCNRGPGSSGATFRLLITHVDTGQSNPYWYFVPAPGACVATGGDICGVIGTSACRARLMNIRVTVDDTNSVPESNEGNNTLTRQFDTRSPSSLAASGNTAYAGAALTLSATLRDPATAMGLTGRSVTFTFLGSTQTALTDSAGTARTNWSAPASSGSFLYSASFQGDADYRPTGSSATVSVLPRPTALVVAHVATTYGSLFATPATLSNALSGQPISSQSVTFTFLDSSKIAMTDAAGVARATWIAPVPGSYTYTASFEGNGVHVSSSGQGSVSVSRASTTLAAASTTTVGGGSFETRATLTNAVSGQPISSQSVTFTFLDSSKIAMTDAAGVARAQWTAPSASGNYAYTASFAGSGLFSPAQSYATVQVLNTPPSTPGLYAWGGSNSVYMSWSQAYDPDGIGAYEIYAYGYYPTYYCDWWYGCYSYWTWTSRIYRVGGASQDFTDTYLLSGQTYYYWARACDNQGLCGSWSNMAYATTYYGYYYYGYGLAAGNGQAVAPPLSREQAAKATAAGLTLLGKTAQPQDSPRSAQLPSGEPSNPVEISTAAPLGLPEPIDLQLAYAAADIAPGISESDLKVYRWTGSGWEAVEGARQDTSKKVFVLKSQDASDYRIFVPSAKEAAASNLEVLKVYPNPFVAGSASQGGAGITFEGLTQQARIEIFTVRGEKVTQLEHADATGSLVWNMQNQAGSGVASGTYLYVVTNVQGEKKAGRVAVVRR